MVGWAMWTMRSLEGSARLPAGSKYLGAALRHCSCGGTCLICGFLDQQADWSKQVPWMNPLLRKWGPWLWLTRVQSTPNDLEPRDNWVVALRNSVGICSELQGRGEKPQGSPKKWWTTRHYHYVTITKYNNTTQEGRAYNITELYGTAQGGQDSRNQD